MLQFMSTEKFAFKSVAASTRSGPMRGARWSTARGRAQTLLTHSHPVNCRRALEAAPLIVQADSFRRRLCHVRLRVRALHANPRPACPHHHNSLPPRCPRRVARMLCTVVGASLCGFLREAHSALLIAFGRGHTRRLVVSPALSVTLRSVLPNLHRARAHGVRCCCCCAR
jgi:hypothetical protein